MKLAATLALFTTATALRTRSSPQSMQKQALSVRGGGVDVEQIASETA